MNLVEKAKALQKMKESATKGEWQGCEVGAWGGEGFAVWPKQTRDDLSTAFKCESNSSESASNSRMLLDSMNIIDELCQAVVDAADLSERYVNQFPKLDEMRKGCLPQDFKAWLSRYAGEEKDG